MTKKLITGLLITLLIAISIISLVKNPGFSPPPKLIILFVILLAAAIALKLKLYWLRYPFLLVSIAYFGFYEGSCVCPTGAMQNISLFLSTSKFAKIGVLFLELGVIFAVTFLVGNVYCGWICQKGGIQEFLFQKKLAIKIPEKIEKPLRNLRYFFLILALLYPVFKHDKIFSKIDPYKVIFNLIGSTLMVIILGVTLLASLVLYRPFCRYICPFGALAGLVNRFGLFRLKFNGACLECGLCEKTCELQAIKVRNTDSLDIDRDICIACMECVKACPKKILTEGISKNNPSIKKHQPICQPQL